MKLSIEFYGRLKAQFSTKPLELNVAEPDKTDRNTIITIENIYLDLCQSYGCKSEIKIIKPILNDTFAEWNDPVKTNDVIGFFPPASGG